LKDEPITAKKTRASKIWKMRINECKINGNTPNMGLYLNDAKKLALRN